MSDLAVCRLCKTAPRSEKDRKTGTVVDEHWCPNEWCNLYDCGLTAAEWQTLHGESVGEVDEDRLMHILREVNAPECTHYNSGPYEITEPRYWVVQLAKRISGEGV